MEGYCWWESKRELPGIPKALGAEWFSGYYAEFSQLLAWAILYLMVWFQSYYEVLERKENSLNHWLNFDYSDVVNFLLLIHTILLLLYFL